jgi:transcriptional regulator with XRE-family HTH domain
MGGGMNIESHEAKALREKHRLTQAQFWNRIGITQSGGSRYESSDRAIPAPVQLLLAITYGRDWQSVVRDLRRKK